MQLKYGEKFTPEEDALLLPWVNKDPLLINGVDWGTLDVPYHVECEIAEQLRRPTSAIVNRIRYLRQKRRDEKQRMEHHFSHRDMELARKIQDVYRKQPWHARICFLCNLVPADELADARRKRSGLIETTAQTLPDQKELPPVGKAEAETASRIENAGRRE